MEHIHNETVLAFLRLHKEHPGIRRLLEKEDAVVKEMNQELGTDYRGYLDYLERNPEDDAGYTMEKLRALRATTG